MFTGIIEEVGKIVKIEKRGEGYRLAIQASTVLTDVQLGDSIAVNGICLTVTSFTSNIFTVDAVPETVRKTNLSLLSRGSFVNLERAMKAGGRFGGHFVAGHIDGIGTITGRQVEHNAIILSISPADLELLKYIIPKGSIAIDGISLTIMNVDDAEFNLSIIPHTMEQTTLINKTIGDQVNLEGDMIGKYIERFVTFQTQGQAKSSRLDEQFLKDNGFI